MMHMVGIPAAGVLVCLSADYDDFSIVIALAAACPDL